MNHRHSAGSMVSQRSSVRSVAAVFAAVVFAVCLGCATPQAIGRDDLLDFLKEGVSTREEVFLHLGEPSALYEGSRIVTYRLSRDEKGWVLHDSSRNWYGVLVNLVLVFDEQGVLMRHARVQIHSP